MQTRAETSSVFIIRPTAQRYGGLAKISWLMRTVGDAEGLEPLRRRRWLGVSRLMRQVAGAGQRGGRRIGILRRADLEPILTTLPAKLCWTLRPPCSWEDEWKR